MNRLIAFEELDNQPYYANPIVVALFVAITLWLCLSEVPRLTRSNGMSRILMSRIRLMTRDRPLWVMAKVMQKLCTPVSKLNVKRMASTSVAFAKFLYVNNT